MNTTNKLEVTAKQELPPLIKQSATYKLIVPRKVEEKIRYLCRKFPTLEWSGVLFTTHEGNFEEGNLVITCQDIYPMDLGSPGFTQFKMDETVSAYIAENIELFDCDVQLVHSHNQMQAYFSGQDQATLREEGNDRNCFVSLIVNNAGTYCAAVTRKLNLTKKVTVETSGVSYEFFGEGKKALTTGTSPVENVSEETVIQYFMLDVEVEKVENPLSYLDARFDDIENKKRAAVPQKIGQNNLPYVRPADRDEDFFDWLHSNRNKSASAKEALYSEPYVFEQETMTELVDVSKWEPDPTVIHYLVCQLVTCSLIVDSGIDIKQWITKWMTKKYDQIFSGSDSIEFENWAESYIEFIINHYSDDNTPEELYDDMDIYQSKIANALCNELSEYPSNDYMSSYITILKRYNKL